jgi:hypothetical protein
MKTRAFWDIVPCSVGVDRRFRGAYCLHHQGDDIKMFIFLIMEAVHAFNVQILVLYMCIKFSVVIIMKFEKK